MKTNRFEVAFLAAVCIFAVLAFACGTPVPACTNNTRTEGNDEFKRWSATVSKNGSAVSDDCWNPLADSDTLSTDGSGEAELNFSACWSGRIFIFKDSGATFRVSVCRKADYAQNGTCVLSGDWYTAGCSGEFIVHTGSASIEKDGTTLSVTYLPDKLDLTLVVVLEGRVRVTPVDSFDPTVFGPVEIVSAGAAEGTFYFTMPLDRLGPVAGLDPRRVYPVDRLPALVDDLGLRDWMLKVAEKAAQDNVLPPNWPKELGGAGQSQPGDGFSVTGGGGALFDPSVQEALFLAVDWPAVQKAGAPGGGTVTVTIGDKQVDVRDLAYDPSRSWEQLKAAGYQPVAPITLLYPAEDGLLAGAAKQMAEYLQGLRLGVQIEGVPGGEMNAVVQTRMATGEEIIALMR